MPYTNVQFIGYVIDTAPQLNPNGSQTYLGLANPQQDIEARCALMLRAMETARDALPQMSPPPPSESTLKVFVAPEFFFRGATGAYEMDDVQLAIATLQRMTADAEWADWVFVFGTIVGTSIPSTANNPSHEVYNFSLVQQGGLSSGAESGARAVIKELMSGIDFIADHANPNGLLLGEVEHLPAAQSSDPGREQQRLNYDGAGIFDLADITWALEVCLDHAQGRLQQSPQLPGENLVQLQIVPSCGMSVQTQNIIAQQGGYVFNCDGYRQQRHSTLQQVSSPPVNILATSSAAVSAAPITLPTSSPVESVDIAALYADGAGVVHLYGACAMPAAQTVTGRIVQLDWPASADYRFSFDLIYNTQGDFVTLECRILSSTTDFHGNRYFLPLQLDTQDPSQQPVSIAMRQAPGSQGYDRAVWCSIHVPGFIFEGNAFEFSNRIDGPSPSTIW